MSSGFNRRHVLSPSSNTGPLNTATFRLKFNADRKYKFQAANPKTQSLAICDSQRRAMIRTHSLSSTRGAFASLRCRCISLHAGGSGIPVQNLNTYGKAQPKYSGRNWSKSLFPVRSTNSASWSLPSPMLLPDVAWSADTCCALTSVKPTLVFSATTALGFIMSFNSTAKSSTAISSRTGVAAFCRMIRFKSLSYGKMATSSSGTPSSGNASAWLYIASMHTPWNAGCPLATASAIRPTTTLRRTRA